MKVRHKATGIEFEVQKMLRDFKYYSTTGGSMIHVDDPAFEIVPEEVWEDCTEDVEIFRDTLKEMNQEYFIHDGKYVCLNNGYRLRKIDGLHHGPAFIVEKKKEG